MGTEELKYHDRIIHKDGSWKKGRFATVISVGEDGVMLARFGSHGKYFEAPAKNYVKKTDSV